jgi:hypothetical protein
MKVSIELTIKHNPSAAAFADQMMDSLPDRDFLHDLRAASIPAVGPVTYRLRNANGIEGTITVDE